MKPVALLAASLLLFLLACSTLEAREDNPVFVWDVNEEDIVQGISVESEKALEEQKTRYWITGAKITYHDE